MPIGVGPFFSEQPVVHPNLSFDGQQVSLPFHQSNDKTDSGKSFKV
jgi:hypothetical protein